MKQLSLRWRLVLGLVVVVTAGLLATDIVTYFVVRSFLFDRVDSQLSDAAVPALSRISLVNPAGGMARPNDDTPGGAGRYPDRRPPSYVPPGTYGELRRADGSAASLVFEFDSNHPTPDIPADISVPPGGHTFFNAGAEDGDASYRVRAQALPNGDLLLVAIPLTDVDRTLDNLRLTEILVTVAVVLLVAGAAFWLVRLGLRPLDAIAETAGEIARGNLTRRIEHAESRTEIGRLSQALNHMLTNLEASFSEQKRLEERLRRFVADASHELRTPLTSIRGYAELFSRGASERPEDLARVMRRIDQESARMGILVEDLLLLARLDQDPALKVVPVDLTELAADAVDDATVLAPDRTITLDAAPGVIVHGDEARLRQVLTNLVTNAVKHTPATASITVTVARDEREAMIRVADEGPGLAPEDAARVFEPFYRVDKGRARSMGGAGLGLAIVKAIVTAHGGRVTARPNQPHGAVFEVALPLERPAAARS